MQRWLIALALLAPAGCGEEDRACTLIGCDESVAHVWLDGLPRGPVDVRICADDHCHEAEVLREEQAVASVLLDHELGDGSRLVVEVRRRGRVIARGAGEVPVSVSRPNGPECPPECRAADGRLDLGTGRLEPA